MPDYNNVAKLAEMLNGIVIISSDISENDLAEFNIDHLAAIISEHFSNTEGLKILTKKLLDEIMRSDSKAPVNIEITRNANHEAQAKEIESKFKIKESLVEKTTGTADSFAEYFQDRFTKLRNLIETGTVTKSMLKNIESLKQYTNGREISIVGMVNDKIVTKNGNILLTLEDETGIAKVIFSKSDQNSSSSLFEAAKSIIYDDVIAVQGKILSPFIIAKNMIYPNIPIRNRKTTEEDFAVAFMSDMHIGSKLFMEKNFTTMLKWLNGNLDYKKDLAGKIKYIVIGGDLVDGIGVYPNQDRDLAVTDVYRQYSIFFDFMKMIPDYIDIFILPGNHDAVHRAEPQPKITDDLLGDFKQDNVHIISNPSSINLHGLNILAYHGASLDSIIRNVPNCSYSRPETAMREILKRRHLSPVYGGNLIVPARTDSLVITEIPDILLMGHVHKNGIMDYHGTLMINSGTWQARTEFQIKQGHVPTPAIMPVYEPKSMVISSLDFNLVQ
jgi:DNA polymerase II small subunit